ncbi:unnamed protein product [Closterium sp. Yama58-4]|nr:unnamed protein product [Closterium sp. Yama58-4]
MATRLQPSFVAAHIKSAVPSTAPPLVSAFPVTFPRIPPASVAPSTSPCVLPNAPLRGAPPRARIRSSPRTAPARAAAGGDEPLPAAGDPSLAAAAWEALVAVRASRPLVHCITNFVSMDAAANTLLAAGAAPAMVHSLEEVEEFASLASALYVNIGTLSPDWVDSMKRVAKVISARNRPWVLDPVGCGATSYRTKTSAELLALRPTVVRGNASEVLALAGAVSANTRGVDSTVASTAAVEAAQQLAAEWGTVVAVSGATDFITDGRTVLACDSGAPLLTSLLSFPHTLPPRPSPLQGVDSTVASTAAVEAAQQLAAEWGTVVAVSGATDFITDGHTVLACHNGWHQQHQASKALGLIECSVLINRGAGHSSDAVSHSLLPSSFLFRVFRLASEVASASPGVQGPGSLRVGLMDALYSLTEEQVIQGVKLSSISV